MNNVVNILKIVLSLFPLIIEAIKKVEEALPMQGAGTQKLEVVKGLVQTAYEQGNETAIKFEQIWAILSGLIANLVAAFNVKGIFKKEQTSI